MPNKEMIARILVLLLALINQIVTSTGRNPLLLPTDEIASAVSMLITAGAGFWNWYGANKDIKQKKNL